MAHSILIIESFVALAFVRLGLLLLPFHTFWALHRKWVRPRRRTTANAVHPTEIMRTVVRVSNYLPRCRTCLVRALAEQAVLHRHGQFVTLRFGVARGPEGLHAHAWLETMDGTVLCGEQQTMGFRSLPVLHQFTSQGLKYRSSDPLAL